MIRNMKKTSKFVSVLSVVLALVMLGTTVFASGVLSDLAADDYIVEITNNGEKIELTNKPFIENGEVYVPLRELFEKVGVMEHPDSKIEWNNGKIDFSIAFYDEAAVAEHQSLNNGQGVDIVTFIFNHSIEIGKPSIIENTVPNLAGQDISNEKVMNNAPVLRNGNTYIPYSYIKEILDTQQWAIEYSVYDKAGNLIERSYDILMWQEEAEIFADPYSDFLTANIRIALGDVGLDDTYSYEYINHIYNDPNDKVDFRYSLNLFGDGNETQILKISFKKNGNEWVMYNSEIEQ